MNIQLLQWGLLSFMIGMVLSLPLAAVHYKKNSPMSKFFINQRKLKAAHLDFFMQAFAVGFAYLIEFALKTEYPLFVIIPLIYGVMMNPTILLIESTAYVRSKTMKLLYFGLRATSPISLLFSWCYIFILFMPVLLKIILVGVILVVGYLFYKYRDKSIKATITKNI
ncbi:hypothetical protein [Neobacillus sp. D3-1R]|uniref:hypothetical protein n=1 Tax=Neobacillus sp. D3-1R TaxID=3445778 RepID=UPI003FA18C44